MIIQIIPSYETKCASIGAKKLGIQVTRATTTGDVRECHVGSLDFLTPLLQGFNESLVTPDYYPEFLYEYRLRSISPICFSGTTTLRRVFAKPINKYKGADHNTTGRIFEEYEFVPKTHLISNVVNFWKEARYYVADGNILAIHEYPVNEQVVNTDFWPKVDFPEGFCGAVDFGYLEDGRFALVESQHPYACGWYGTEEEADIYALWLQIGWDWMIRTGGLK